MDMRLATTLSGYFAVVYQDAQRGGIICRLEPHWDKCILLVVLSPRVEGGYTFVGEVAMNPFVRDQWSKTDLESSRQRVVLH